MANIRRLSWRIPTALALAAGFTLVLAQEAPEPGPEHARLGFFVGKWSNEGVVKENPVGFPAGKFTGQDQCDWFDGKFAVVCHSKGSGPMGDSTGLAIMSYSPMAGVYTYYGTDSMGMTMTSVPHGKVEDKTWVYDDESEMGGVTLKNRFTIVETSDKTYTFKWEIYGEDGWATVMEGQATKA